MKIKHSTKLITVFSFSILAIAAVCLLMTKILVKRHLKTSDCFCLIEPEKNKYSVFEGERFKIHFKIENLGRSLWTSRGQYPTFLSYHLLDEQENCLKYDNRRFPLPQKVKPTQSTELTITLRSPLEAGKYILEFDLLKERLAWFKDYGSKTSKIDLLVKEKTWPDDKYDLSLDYGKFTKLSSSVDEINKIFKLIRFTLSQNEVSFNGKAGEVCGFSAGTDYPQIWLRDANTIIPASRYFYDKQFLCSWLEEHLVFQKKNGSLEDWIDSRGKSDKNTTETDQESSTVQAAFQIFKIIGPHWLEKKIKSERIITRLEKSLNYVLLYRFNDRYGLLTGAHTADWGDVDMVDEDKNAVYVDKRTHWTADIYDQSMFYQSCLNLVEMLYSLGQSEKAEYWQKTADSIKRNTDQWLWQEDKGFYRIHLHLDTLKHDFDEDNIFPMGGNSQAILSGLAGADKCRHIIEQALKRQKSFSVSTISGTLLPPYPAKFFLHPMLDDPYEYQNGAQWDWFGGRLVYSMFECGTSRTARDKLKEIIRKNLSNRGFFEWDNRDGTGLGSDLFCGSAGMLGKALFEGYFGLKLGENDLHIEPKLGRESAKIHFYQPANDIFIAYYYSFNPDNNKLTFKYNSNFPHKGTIKILSPWPDLNERINDRKIHLDVSIDGEKVDFKLQSVYLDEFIIFESDFKNHTAYVLIK